MIAEKFIDQKNNLRIAQFYGDFQELKGYRRRVYADPHLIRAAVSCAVLSGDEVTIATDDKGVVHAVMVLQKLGLPIKYAYFYSYDETAIKRGLADKLTYIDYCVKNERISILQQISRWIVDFEKTSDKNAVVNIDKLVRQLARMTLDCYWLLLDARLGTSSGERRKSMEELFIKSDHLIYRPEPFGMVGRDTKNLVQLLKQINAILLGEERLLLFLKREQANSSEVAALLKDFKKEYLDLVEYNKTCKRILASL